MQVQVDWKDLRDYCAQLFMRMQVPEDEAMLIADSLVEADLAGIASHGVTRMPVYMRRLETGIVEPKGRIRVVEERPGSLALDACNSMGIVAGVMAMDMAVEKARTAGAVFTTVRHSNHFGTAAFFTKRAAQQGMIGIAGTNAPPNMAPWGSTQAYVGTNPFSVAIPTAEGPIVLDMATSVVAKGKIILAAKTGKDIPLGWAITADGKPTTDANEAMAGTVLPFGGVKGYAIALLVEILSGVLSGAQYGPHLNNLYTDFVNPQDIGHFLAAIDIKAFIDPAIFRDRMRQMTEEIRSLPKAPGVQQIYMPGEIENAAMRRNREEGLRIPEEDANDLMRLGDALQVSYESLFKKE